jgi:signal transduction histidine kinase
VPDAGLGGVALPGQTGAAPVWWLAGALVVAVVLASALGLLLWRERRSLRALAAAVRALKSEHPAAGAAPAGPAPVREVAQAINALAEEGYRLQAQEAESGRLRAMAREVGFRIREHLRVEDLLTEARVAIEQNVDADAVHLQLIDGADIGQPVGHEHNWLLPRSINEMLSLDDAEDLLRTQSSLVVQDTSGADGYRLLKSPLREALSGAGVVSHLFTPFGVDRVLGFIAAERLRPGHPWTPSEIDAVQSIAADLGRGLHHARLYEAENRLVEDLQRLDASRLEFFATVAHELRSPLTGIEGYVEMLADGEAGDISPRQAKMLETIDRRSVQLRSLVDDLLTLSRLETGAATAAFRPVNLAQAISDAAEAIAPTASAGGLTLTATPPPPATTISGDAAQLDRVLLNLLSNAVKYTPPGGQVTVRATATPTTATITVTDTGMGIPQPDQEKLFTRFYRASNATSSQVPGTGLGLAIVASIVENHHGTIELTSREGTGTRITIDLPVEVPTRADDAGAQSPPYLLH